MRTKYILLLLLICFKSYGAPFGTQVTETLRFLNARPDNSIVGQVMDLAREVGTQHLAHTAGMRTLGALSRHTKKITPESWHRLVPFLCAHLLCATAVQGAFNYALSGRIQLKRTLKHGMLSTAAHLLSIAINKIHGTLPPGANLMHWGADATEESLAESAIRADKANIIQTLYTALIQRLLTRAIG